MDPDESNRLKLAGELGALRLELEQREREIEQLRAELERRSFSQQESSEEKLNNRLETLFEAISQGAIQVWTQAYLVERKGKALSTQDVLSSAKRLAAALRQQGLEPLGEFDSVEPFDPNRHTPLGAQEIAPGDRVRLRLVGTQYRGKILRKANVEKAED